MMSRVLFVSLFVMAPFLSAQTAAIDGTVTDQTRAVMPGVKIVVANLDTGLRRQTSADGNYSVTLLHIGRYRVEAIKQGFGRAEQTAIQLNVQQVARIDFTLQPEPVVEAIEVSATAVTLDSETSTVGQVIDNKRIVELPLPVSSTRKSHSIYNCTGFTMAS
jgi:hypothetical protein